MNALQLVPADHYVVVTNDISAKSMEEITAGTIWETYVGSDTDVLDRYVQALKVYPVDRILRATADNPAVSYELARSLVAYTDPVSYMHFENTPKGLGTELISVDALLQAHAHGKRAEDREHVTPYIIANTAVKHLALPSQYVLSCCNVSLDTEADYIRLTRMFELLYKEKPLSIDATVRWCKLDYINLLQSGGCA